MSSVSSLYLQFPCTSCVCGEIRERMNKRIQYEGNNIDKKRGLESGLNLDDAYLTKSAITSLKLHGSVSQCERKYTLEGDSTSANILPTLFIRNVRFTITYF